MKRSPILLLSLILAACGGGGSPTSNTAVTAISSTVSPVSVTITEPMQVAATQMPVVIDPCAVPKHQYGDITYPTSYSGAYPIPTPKGKLPSNIVRTMNLQDVDAWWERPLNSQCTSPNLYRANVIIEDLNRMQQLGVERVWVYNYAQWDDFSQPIWNAIESDYALPRSVLQTVVKEAHKRNIKVYYAYQLSNNCDSRGVCLDPQNLSPADLTKLLESHKQHIINDAIFGTQIGLDGIKAEPDAYEPKFAKNYNAIIRGIYIKGVTSTIDEIRKVFNGKIAYGQNDPVYDNEIFSRIDELDLTLFLAHNVDPFTTSNWKDYTTVFISYFQYWIQQESGVQKINVPIAWQIYSESAKEFYTSSWLDDFCTTTTIAQNHCPQESFVTDFSLQAISIEGSLEALLDQSTFTTESISFVHYFHNDDITPTDLGGAINFPNINASIRNKPAEGIVRQWFKR